jgi:hypothetical protein
MDRLRSTTQILFKLATMDVRFTSAEEALCPHIKDTAGREEHVLKPHLPISSIPSPDEPLSIGSFPIEIHTQTATFNPKNIANLWLQLLSLHVQNGNFWTYKNVLEAREEKLKARDTSTSDSKPKKSPLDEKHGETVFTIFPGLFPNSY